jgi:hypothetical protein
MSNCGGCDKPLVESDGYGKCKGCKQVKKENEGE